MEQGIRESWTSAVVPGKTFADVGGLWGTVQEMVTVAARAGATETTMVDVLTEDEGGVNLWDRFKARAASFGVTNTRCVMGSIDDPNTPDRIGVIDVVHCNGVLYHCPHPLHTLQQLRRITGETLILGTATIPETVARPAGTVMLAPGTALLVPAMTDEQRVVLGDWLGTQAVGVNWPVAGEWSPDDYRPWWWFFTVGFVSSLLRIARFDVRNVAGYWDGKATLYHAEVAPPLT